MAPFGLEPTLLSCQRWSGLFSGLGFICRASNQFDQPVKCLLPVLLLSAVLPRIEHKDSVTGNSLTPKFDQTVPNTFR
jgi:hypothetical protein